MPIMNLCSRATDLGGRSRTKQMHIASVLLSAVCLNSVAEAVVRDAAGRSSRSAGHACNFLRGCHSGSHTAEPGSHTAEPPEPTDGSQYAFTGNKTFHVFSPSANRTEFTNISREFTNITLHVEGQIILTDSQKKDESVEDTELSNAALQSNVTCDEGVVCNGGVIDNKKNFSSVKDVPHANVSSCETTKWVQLDLRELYLVQDVALFWPHNATSPRKYCSLRLDVSKDGRKWVVIYTNPGKFSRETDGKGFWLTIPEKNSEARFVRWYSSRSDVSPSVEFAEMQVFGTTVASKTLMDADWMATKGKNQTKTSGKPIIKILPAEKFDDSGKDATPPWSIGYGSDAARAPASAPPAFPPEEWAMTA